MTLDPRHLPHVFHARSLRSADRLRIATGFNELDEALHGGWPAPALIEILIDVYGIGELQLLLPLLRQLTRAAPQPALVVWLNPPHVPNGVAFAQHKIDARHWVSSALTERDLLWSCEQSLRSQACSAVLGWISTANTAALRRLKLAAMNANCVGIVFRASCDARDASPASLRLVLHPHGEQLLIDVIKNEGRMPRRLVLGVGSGTRQAPRA